MTQPAPLYTQAPLKPSHQIYQQRFAAEFQIIPPPQPPLVNKPDVIIIDNVPKVPNYSRCIYCNQQTDTYETYKDGPLVWIMCIILMFFTIFFFWVAFCIESWKDLEFRCVKCHQVKFVRKGKCC